MKRLILTMAAAAALAAQSETKYWRGTDATSPTLASVAANWSPAGVPTAADDVVLDADSSNKPLTWDVDNGVKSWTQSDYTGTVTFPTGISASYSSKTYTCHGVATGYMTGELGFPISGNLTLNSGTWTHTATPAQTSTSKGMTMWKQGYGIYRLIVSVGGDCTIAAGASIDVNAKGFGTDGPGYSNSCASHGGFGGYNYTLTTATSAIYGSFQQPISLGTGRSTVGGGAIKLTVAGALTLNGTLTSIGPRTGAYPGSGGSIWVTASSLAGTTGKICADGGAGTTSVGCGGSGRVAVYLTGDGQDFSAFAGTITAYNKNVYGTCGTVYRETKADGGAGELIIDSGMTDTATPKSYSERGCATLLKETVGGVKSFSFGKITLGKWSKLYVGSGLTVTVDDVEGVSASTLLLDGATLNVPANFQQKGFRLATYNGTSTVNVGSGSSTYALASAAGMTLDGPLTLNGSLAVTGTVTHTAGATSTYTNRIDLTVTGDMTVAPAGQINVTSCGFAAKEGLGGSSSAELGGVYGGTVTGSDKHVYGSILHPTDLGSSGTVGGAAGAVKLTVGGKLTLNNNDATHVSIAAYGNNNNGGSNGSGGSVWLTVGELAGNGIIDAKGGTYAGSTKRSAAGGSGGRIAIRQTKGNVARKDTAITFRYNGGSSTGGSSSNSGTLYWETATDGLDRGVVYCDSKQLPPDGMPSDELNAAKVQVGSSTVLTLTGDTAVGDLALPKNASLVLDGYTLKVLDPASSYRQSVLGTVDAGEGGRIDWPLKGLILLLK